MSDLPYEFDLLYDVKSIEELYSVFKGELHCTNAENWELEELCKIYAIPLPASYKPSLKEGFPTIVWISNNGYYQNYAPTYEEKHKFQRMKIFLEEDND